MTRPAPARVTASVPATQRGFTLLELMVVVIIIGVMTTFAVLSLGNSAARRVDEEAYRFASLIRLAADEAVLQGREIGIEIKRDGYVFHQFDDQFRQWVPMATNLVYRSRTLTEGMTIDLRLDDQEMVLPAVGEAEDGEEEDPPQPQVLLLSSGEMTPFELIFEFQDIEVVLKATANGAVETQSTQ